MKSTKEGKKCFHIKITDRVVHVISVLRPAFCACGFSANAEETNNGYLNVSNQVRLIRTK